jgi:hypothetical protein
MAEHRNLVALECIVSRDSALRVSRCKSANLSADAKAVAQTAVKPHTKTCINRLAVKTVRLRV